MYLHESTSTMVTSVDVDDRSMSVVGLNVKRNSEAVISVVLSNEAGKQSSQSSRIAENRGEYAKLLGLIYAILLIVIGFLLCLAESVSHNWLGTAPSAAFSIYLLAVGTAFLLFLQFYLLRSSTAENKNERSDIVSSLKYRLVSCCNRVLPVGFCRRRNANAERQQAEQTTAAAVSENKERYVTPNKPKVRNVQFDLRGNKQTVSTPEIASVRQRDSISVVSGYSGRNMASFVAGQRTRSTGGVSEAGESVDADSEDSLMFWMDLDKLGNLFSHRGSNFYLRIGALFFGLGHVIYAALEVENWANPDKSCTAIHYNYGWIFILRLVFIIVQTFVLFKGTYVKIEKFQPLAYFGFMHLIATNLSLWLFTQIREISEVLLGYEDRRVTTSGATVTTTEPTSEEVITTIHYPHRRSVTNSQQLTTDNSSAYTGLCQNSPLGTVSRYLFPFVLEYSLIAMGAIAFILYNGIGSNEGSDGHRNVARGFKNLIRVFTDNIYVNEKNVDSNDSNNNQLRNSHQDNNHEAETENGQDSHAGSMLAKSHTGLFIGVLLLAAVLTCVVLFYFGIAVTDFQRSTQIYLVTDIVLHSCLLVACCLALFLTRNLAYVAKPLSTDDGLLFLTMTGSLIFEFAVIVSAITHIGSSESSQLVSLDLAASSLASIQTVLQAILILNAMRRLPASASDVIKMPGRGTFSFLIIGNVAVWIQRTMQVKELESLGREDIYGSVAWLMITNINLPLLLFYRFHSSVSFADIRSAAYTPLYHEVTSNSPKRVKSPSSPLATIAALSFSSPRPRSSVTVTTTGSDRSSESSVVVVPARISTSAPGSPRGRRKSTVSAVNIAVLGETYRMNQDDFQTQLTYALEREINANVEGSANGIIADSNV